MLGIIIVNYKSIDQTVDYIQQELCKITTPHKIVVVNVACDDCTNISLTKKLGAYFITDVDTEVDETAHIFVLAHPDNLGYARGNNLGADFLRKHFSPDYLLITNNDLELQGDVVKTLIDTLTAHENVGAIGPRVIGNDGSCQSPHRYIPYWRFVLSKLFYPFFVLLIKNNLLGAELVSNAIEGYYYRLMGCFLVMPAKVFHAVGGFDPKTFLYGEELILSERLASNGLYCYFQPAAIIIHNHGQTISKCLSSSEISILMFESQLFYYRHYRGVSTLECIFGEFSMWLYLYCHLPILRILKRK